VSPLVGRVGAGSDGLVTDLQSKLGVAIGEAEAKLRRVASARLWRMEEIEGIFYAFGRLYYLAWLGCWKERTLDEIESEKAICNGWCGVRCGVTVTARESFCRK